MKLEELEYRMYGIVPYNLSPIQQGIQFGHAVVEYIMQNPPEPYGIEDDGIRQWMQEDKTFMVMNVSYEAL